MGPLRGQCQLGSLPMVSHMASLLLPNVGERLLC